MKFIEHNLGLTEKKFAPTTTEQSGTEILQLQQRIQQINDEYERKRRALEEDCREQLDALEENTRKTQKLHDELQKSSFVRPLEKKKSSRFFFRLSKFTERMRGDRGGKSRLERRISHGRIGKFRIDFLLRTKSPIKFSSFFVFFFRSRKTNVERSTTSDLHSKSSLRNHGGRTGRMVRNVRSSCSVPIETRQIRPFPRLRLRHIRHA